VGITAGSREVSGRNACDKRHPCRIIIIIIIIIFNTETNDISTTNSNNRIAATLYSIGT